MIITQLKKEFDRRVYEEGVERIKKTLNMLSSEEVWYAPNQASNSVGVLCLHLCGNVTQWIGTGIGRAPDIRTRDKEFAPEVRPSKEELIAKLEALKPITDQAFSTVVNDAQLSDRRSVQGYDESVLAIIVHVIEHFSYHVGQIAIITKHLKGQDLGFYAGQDLNAKS